jgi:hypothetical protein
MTLEQQIQTLIDGAPQDGRTPALIEAIVPALQEIALQLQHQQYYLLQNAEQRWLTTILSNRQAPDQEKNRDLCLCRSG